MTKVKEEKKYKNIPVKPEVYQAVQLISEANGFGERGMGAQVASWAARELPHCEHDKTPVSIETFPSDTSLARSQITAGYYCATCKRVYRRIGDGDIVLVDRKKLMKAVSRGS